MATTKRETTTVSKERRGISPSNSHGATTTQRSTNRQVPNYLKPTVSSRPDVLKNPRKTGPAEDTAHKPSPSYLRRRSFDKPPSAVRVQKALISPGPRDRADPPRDRPTTLRSTSFSSRTTTAPKPALERATKTPKATAGAKPHATSSLRSTIKKSVTPTGRKQSVPSASKKATSPPSSHETKQQVMNLETKHESENECLVHDVEEIVKVESTDHQSEAPEIPKSEENEHLDVIHAEEKSDDIEEAEDGPYDISTVPEENTVLQGQTEENEQEEDTLDEEKTVESQPECQEIHSKEESDNHHEESSSIAGANIDQAEEKEEEKMIATEELAAAAEEIAADESKEGDETSQKIEPKEGQEAEKSEEEAKPETVAAPAKRPAAQGKKDSPAAYNDVIEETASKLLEKRKNKVRALVGAFETVIDYETAASK